MTHWKLTLAYDGTPFRGWQVQPRLPTVQGLLADAIHRTVGEQVLPQGSGRTDAGVHALGQVASFSLAASIPASNLHNALNRCLPPSIRVLSVQIVSPAFHARHSAIRKTYEYRIFPLKTAPNSSRPKPDAPRIPSPVSDKDQVSHPLLSYRDEWYQESPTVQNPICPPTLAPYVWPCPWPLDLVALNQAAAQVLGTHDFTTFAASDPDLTNRMIPKYAQPLYPGHPRLRPCPSQPTIEASAAGVCSSVASPIPQPNIRTITRSAWHAHEDLFIYRVTATGFLHHMVRNLVGTFVQCGAHRLAPESIPKLLAARNRSAAGPTAPPTGLFLLNVEYPSLEPQTSNFEREP